MVSINLAAQPSVFFGMDMNQDWYTLTNYSLLTYFQEAEENDLVASDFEYYLNKVHIELEDFELDLLVVFESIKNANSRVLESLFPYMLVGRHLYDNDRIYDLESSSDCKFLLDKVARTYGKPDLVIEEIDLKLYKWNFDFGTITLRSSRTESNTALIYFLYR